MNTGKPANVIRKPGQMLGDEDQCTAITQQSELSPGGTRCCHKAKPNSKLCGVHERIAFRKANKLP